MLYVERGYCMRQGVLIDDKKWFQCFEYLIVPSDNLPSHDPVVDAGLS